MPPAFPFRRRGRRRPPARLASLALAAALIALGGGCGPAGPDAKDAGGADVVRVPAQAPTIQAAVDRARPGGLVLVSPGVYHETVRIRTERVVLRGTDRNRVVIDGQGRRNNGVVVTARGVSVENLTVRNHLLNGVLVTGMTDGADGIARGSDGYTRLDPARFPPLTGFRVRYVTAHANGLYGIYAFNARDGVLEDNHASGSADSGLYVGQCKPCRILVRGNVAEYNAVGYEGTNASGDMWVLGNRFTRNRVGMTVDSEYLEAYVPQSGATVAGNLVADNTEAATPEQADGGFGIGIGIAGGTDNDIRRNLVTGNSRAGIVLASTEDLPPLRNRVTANTATGNGVDIAYQASQRAPGQGNCLQGNTAHRTLPAALAATAPCPRGNARSAGAVPRLTPAPAGIPFLDVAPPPAQPQMPHAATAPAAPATGLPGAVHPESVPLPGPGLLAAGSRTGAAGAPREAGR
ncbi:nitrous oxide reductase family maturation protein NosD [Streptomyces sp. NPDC021020]|uniref:nitrous oxide reductase family maturation protein NosD n=1 Tax=Streptomyces sp. NPDC021020 TaxID=3365109 RepID=UPI0037B85C55